MIVDTSAIIAILRDEPEGAALAAALAGGGQAFVSAGTYLEAAIVVDSNRDPVLSRRLDDLLQAAGVQTEPVTARQAEPARRAYQDFGKGSGHPVVPDFGDCFAYALAHDLVIGADGALGRGQSRACAGGGDSAESST